MSQNFQDLPMHDASVHELTLEWATGTVRLRLSVFFVNDRDAAPAELVFSNVALVDVPRENPWGPSVFINSFSFQPPNIYSIEMQSGDVVRIRAETFELRQAEHRSASS